MNNVPDKIVIEWTIDKIMEHWPQDELEPHLINVISAMRGWLPLVKHQKMIVAFGDSEYSIMRIK